MLSQDPKSGLYPFMMFVVVADGALEVYSLSNIYNTLLQQQTVLKFI